MISLSPLGSGAVLETGETVIKYGPVGAAKCSRGSYRLVGDRQAVMVQTGEIFFSQCLSSPVANGRLVVFVVNLRAQTHAKANAAL